jgi:hypothetical protein
LKFDYIYFDNFCKMLFAFLVSDRIQNKLFDFKNITFLRNIIIKYWDFSFLMIFLKSPYSWNVNLGLVLGYQKNSQKNKKKPS